MLNALAHHSDGFGFLVNERFHCHLGELIFFVPFDL
jgi:hypothetical protein